MRQVLPNGPFRSKLQERVFPEVFPMYIYIYYIYMCVCIPVVPARGGAKVALGIYYKTFFI